MINLIELCKYRLYACCYCNTKSRTVAFYDYYDTPLAPYCIDCFTYVMNELLNKYNKAIQNIKLPEDKIEEIEKMNKDISISYDCYKSVLSDNDKLRDRVKQLEKECQAWKDKYSQEKMNHTSTEARIAYAKHILDGNRDEKY